MEKKNILVTGATGQLGSVLTKMLQRKHGLNNVIASDLKKQEHFEGLFEFIDVTDFDALQESVLKNEITEIYHLAAILSANGEKNPLNTWDVNMKSLFNVLEVSRIHGINKVFYPSSIAVFGDNVKRVGTPQSSNLTPSTVYGISKASGENWVNYYYTKYGLDVRSIRYPGIIGYQSMPSGGTTDYAVDIYHKAVKQEPFECFLEASTELPMIFMDDAIRATIELMNAPSETISVRTSYNVSGMSFTPKQVFHSIHKLYPDFEIKYKPDFRQDIANSWPKSIDDSFARKDWGWKPEYDLDRMTTIMIKKLRAHYNAIKI
ncbi:NAD-dependent epimerase/dehydratase family protein [Algibacter mikhailovii]|uniref:NAD-dependent epimerase/dehydratase family protein n=1 Tax=Algibacter mikhailovii TaxID=425498 RepID=UPI00249459C0|nr:NAD-dependent epimerase/dehydratase family protein [Algibacter mikhailovii]